MTKRLALSILSTVSLSAHAAGTPTPLPALPIRFQCIANPPTTSFIVTHKNQQVSMTMIQHNGPRYMPIFYGNIAPSDLPFLQEKANIFTQIPARITLTWPEANCKNRGNHFFQCFSDGGTQMGTLKVESFGFYTSKTTREAFGRKMAAYNVNFTIQVNSIVHDIQMDYGLENCVFSDKI